jgi:hypothetical protein
VRRPHPSTVYSHPGRWSRSGQEFCVVFDEVDNRLSALRSPDRMPMRIRFYFEFSAGRTATRRDCCPGGFLLCKGGGTT